MCVCVWLFCTFGEKREKRYPFARITLFILGKFKF